MKVIYGIGNLDQGSSGPKVVAVGVFDGVHRGHRLVLRKTVLQAKKKKYVSAVVTFLNHPSAFFYPSQKVPTLTTLKHKLSFIEEEGIDYCYVIDFNKTFSCFDPKDFVKNFLVRRLNMKALYVGQDFVFGKGACGNINLLRTLGKTFGFTAHIIKHLRLHGRIVSSTLIRDLIYSGNIKLAQVFLGRHVSLVGRVIHGEKRGRALGFPTANIKPFHELIVPDGIYATKVFCEGKIYKSATYIGTKPTFKDVFSSKSIEVFLIGFNRNLYGKEMEIQFFKKIRDDKKFRSVESLISQMRRDVIQAKNILS